MAGPRLAGRAGPMGEGSREPAAEWYLLRGEGPPLRRCVGLLPWRRRCRGGGREARRSPRPAATVRVGRSVRSLPVHDSCSASAGRTGAGGMRASAAAAKTSLASSGQQSHETQLQKRHWWLPFHALWTQALRRCERGTRPLLAGKPRPSGQRKTGTRKGRSPGTQPLKTLAQESQRPV